MARAKVASGRKVEGILKKSGMQGAWGNSGRAITGVLAVLFAFGLLAPGKAAASPGLSDGRAYEQATPTDKDGNDAIGSLPTVKAAASGGGITFASTFGIPGGKGAQDFPTYLASRGGNN